MSPEERKKWQDAKDSGDEEAMEWEPPSELELEVSDVSVTGNGKFASMTEDGKNGEND